MWDINLVRTCWSGTVLLRVSIATMNHHDKKSSWGGQTLFRLYIHVTHCSSLKKIRIGIQSEKEHRCGSWHRGHEGVLIVGLLLMSCSAFFFVEPMTTSTEMAPSFVIKKNPLQTCLKPHLMEAFSYLRFPSLRRLSLLSS